MPREYTGAPGLVYSDTDTENFLVGAPQGREAYFNRISGKGYSGWLANSPEVTRQWYDYANGRGTLGVQLATAQKATDDARIAAETAAADRARAEAAAAAQAKAEQDARLAAQAEALRQQQAQAEAARVAAENARAAQQKAIADEEARKAADAKALFDSTNTTTTSTTPPATTTTTPPATTTTTPPAGTTPPPTTTTPPVTTTTPNTPVVPPVTPSTTPAAATPTTPALASTAIPGINPLTPVDLTPGAPAAVWQSALNNPAVPTLPGGAQTEANKTALLAGAQGAVNSNQSQIQNSDKASTFASAGITETANQQSQQNATNKSENNTATNKVTDTLGLGALLAKDAPAATTATNTQRNYLSDLVANGDPQFNNKVDTAVRASQSGQVQNSGENAKDRMGAYAVEKVAQDNQNLRLNAAQQLAGPTALSTLSQAGTPYLGNTQASQGSSSELNVALSQLLSKENAMQKGVSQGNTQSQSVGNQPVQNTNGGGGGMSYVCTVLKAHGYLTSELIAAEVAFFKAHGGRYYNAWVAYSHWAVPFANWLSEKHWRMELATPVVKMLISVPAGRGSILGKLFWHPLVWTHNIVGLFLEPKVDKTLAKSALDQNTQIFN